MYFLYLNSLRSQVFKSRGSGRGDVKDWLWLSLRPICASGTVSEGRGGTRACVRVQEDETRQDLALWSQPVWYCSQSLG